MQTIDDDPRFFFSHLHPFSSCGKRSIKPFLEVLDGVEDGRQQKVEKRPKLRQTVLQGRTGEKQPVTRLVVAPKDIHQLARMVLHSVTLIDDDVVPTDLRQHGFILDDVLVGGQQHVELAMR